MYKIIYGITYDKLKYKTIPGAIICTIVIATFIGRFFIYNDMGLARIMYGF